MPTLDVNEEKKPLSHKLGDRLENMQRLHEAGFGNPRDAQNTGKFGHKNSEGDSYLEPTMQRGMNMTLTQDMVEQQKEINKVLGTIAEKLTEAPTGKHPSGGQGLTFDQMNALLAAERAMHVEGLRLAAVGIAEKIGKDMKEGAFAQSRLHKAEDAGWQALGIATGGITAGLIVLALRRPLGI
jgi:hypothetical protein